MFTLKSCILMSSKKDGEKKKRPTVLLSNTRFLPVIAASQVTAHRFLRRQRSLSATLTHSLVCRSKDKKKKTQKKHRPSIGKKGSHQLTALGPGISFLGRPGRYH